MKLYTEEQVRQAYNEGVINGYESSTVKEDKFIKYLTPIELPSDEDIEKELLFGDMIDGAKWMKEQILNQNK